MVKILHHRSERPGLDGHHRMVKNLQHIQRERDAPIARFRGDWMVKDLHQIQRGPDAGVPDSRPRVASRDQNVPLPPCWQFRHSGLVSLPAMRHVEGQYFTRLKTNALPAPSSTLSQSTDSPTTLISP